MARLRVLLVAAALVLLGAQSVQGQANCSKVAPPIITNGAFQGVVNQVYVTCPNTANGAVCTATCNRGCEGGPVQGPLVGGCVHPDEERLSYQLGKSTIIL